MLKKIESLIHTNVHSILHISTYIDHYAKKEFYTYVQEYKTVNFKIYSLLWYFLASHAHH